MPTLPVGSLTFGFPDSWEAQQYDAWTFYLRHFQGCRPSMKAVDLLAWDPAARATWLVEVKDYRRHPRTKAVDLHREVADKVLDTLSALLPAAVQANVPEERDLARKVLGAREVRVLLHLEQPATHSALFPRALDPADVQQKLRQVLRPVDPHCRVAETGRLMGGLAWTVS